jgi:hypothetical protein
LVFLRDHGGLRDVRETRGVGRPEIPRNPCATLAPEIKDEECKRIDRKYRKRVYI